MWLFPQGWPHLYHSLIMKINIRGRIKRLNKIQNYIFTIFDLDSYFKIKKKFNLRLFKLVIITDISISF